MIRDNVRLYAYSYRYATPHGPRAVACV